MVGMVIAFFGWKVLRPISFPLLEWYHNRNTDPQQMSRIHTLLAAGKTHSEEFERYIDQEAFWMTLPLPPLFGLFYGVLLGAVGGALCGLDGDAYISASAAATLGLLIGPVLVALVAAMTLACIVHFRPGLPVRSRLARRGLLIISPLLFVPAAFHCVQRMIQRAGPVAVRANGNSSARRRGRG